MYIECVALASQLVLQRLAWLYPLRVARRRERRIAGDGTREIPADRPESDHTVDCQMPRVVRGGPRHQWVAPRQGRRGKSCCG